MSDGDPRIPLRVAPAAVVLYLGALALFLLNKLVVRPAVLSRDAPRWAEVFVLSMPNAVEAILGTLVLAGLLVVLKLRRGGALAAVPDLALHGLATVLAAAYVVTQELNWHRLGGQNVYDPWDLAASTAGLLLALGFLVRFGVVVPEERSK
ncbi:MAG: hypothetical protein DWQ36_08195 [Acidobacteria bacterium]|nr:MAG: hypothetical protein DWQ30_01920 [Acidobacteriota bacterium]REK08788.1 MAG: hypothetical protein DWQ36_08195 [Acidobacteriota bacterium]